MITTESQLTHGRLRARRFAPCPQALSYDLQCDDLPLIPAADMMFHYFISLVADAESSTQMGGQAKIALCGSLTDENRDVGSLSSHF